MAPVSIYSWEGSRNELSVIWDEWRHIETVERHLRRIEDDWGIYRTVVEHEMGHSYPTGLRQLRFKGFIIKLGDAGTVQVCLKTVEKHWRWVGVSLRHIEVIERHLPLKWAEVNSGPNQLDALIWDMLWHLRHTGTRFKTSGLTCDKLRQVSRHWRAICSELESVWDNWNTFETIWDILWHLW